MQKIRKIILLPLLLFIKAFSTQIEETKIKNESDLDREVASQMIIFLGINKNEIKFDDFLRVTTNILNLESYSHNNDPEAKNKKNSIIEYFKYIKEIFLTSYFKLYYSENFFKIIKYYYLIMKNFCPHCHHIDTIEEWIKKSMSFWYQIIQIKEPDKQNKTEEEINNFIKNIILENFKK